MKEIVLVKYGEMALKGLNKKSFEDMLTKNIKRRLKPLGKFQLTSAQSTTYITPLDEDIDLNEVVEVVGKIFGIAALCRACVCEKNFEDICEKSYEYLEDVLGRAKTFKVNAKRSDKAFPMKSPEICMELGGRLLEKFPHLSVDVKNPEVTVTVEVRDENAFVHAENIKGAGGLPVGSSGKAMLLLSGGIDSPVAGWMTAKRGVVVDAVYFHAPPYTSERAKQKVVDLAKLVSKYSGPMRLYVVNFTEIQMYIYDKCPHDELTIIMRRYMMKIAEYFANKEKAQGLITGESIGQVASQTMQSLAATNEVCTMPVFRPVIAFDKQEIVDISLKIGTYETSILPYEDCCTTFVAKHPVTKPNINVIKNSEKHLAEEIDRMFEEAVNTAELIKIQ